MGYDAKQPSIKFIRLLNELVSSIQYGFSCHQKRIENNPITKQTDLKLRWIQPTDVHEFGVSYDDLTSVAETYNKSIHGIRPTRKVDGETIEVVDIPAEEILHMAPLQMGYNYWGESFLEPALSDWVLKRVYRFANAILQGRFRRPDPVGTDRNATPRERQRHCRSVPATRNGPQPPTGNRHRHHPQPLIALQHHRHHRLHRLPRLFDVEAAFGAIR